MSDVLHGFVGSSALADTGLLFTDAPLRRLGETLTDPPAKEITVSLPGVTWHIQLQGDDPVWFYEVLGGIKRLAMLPTNWDSYGAATIQSDAAARGLLLLSEVLKDDSPTPSMVPTSTGGVQFEWHRSGIDLEIEVDPNEEPTVWYHVVGSGDEWESGPDTNLREELEKLIARLGPHDPNA
jgi:hypothetical protein